jgi:hypothetical protein
MIIRDPVAQEILLPAQPDSIHTSMLRASQSVPPKGTVWGLELLRNDSSGDPIVHLRLVSDAESAPALKRAFESQGAASVIGLDSARQIGGDTPPADIQDADGLGFPRSLDLSSTAFFVMVPQNGHVVTWNLQVEPTFVRSAITTLAMCNFGLVQVLWTRYSTSQLLRRLSSRIASEVNWIPKKIKKQVRVYDGNSDRARYEWEYFDNPEYHSDFRTFGLRISRQLSAKSPFADLVVLVRGVMCPQLDFPSGITDADPAALGSYSSTAEASGLVGERLVCAYSHNPRQLVDLKQRRIPSPEEVLGDWEAEYLRPDRFSPILQPITPQELAPFLHLPAASSLPVRKVGGL